MKDKIVDILLVIYEAAPKEHNKKGYMDELKSRVKSSLRGVKSVEEFISKLIRKTGAKLDDASFKYNKGVFKLENIDDKKVLEVLKNELEYLLVLMTIKREEKIEEAKKKKVEKTKKKQQKTLDIKDPEYTPF